MLWVVVKQILECCVMTVCIVYVNEQGVQLGCLETTAFRVTTPSMV